MPRSYIIPIITFICLLFLTFEVHSIFVKQEKALIQTLVNEEANLLSQAIENHLNSSVIAIQRQAERWETRKGERIEEWRDDAKNYIEDFSALTTLEWVDETYTIRLIEPVKGNENAIGLNIIFDQERKKALEGAAEQHAITLTKPLDLVQGYRAVIVYIPIYFDDQFNGFIVGLFDLAMFFDSYIRSDSYQALQISVQDKNDLVFNNDITSTLNDDFTSTNNIALFDRNWTISVKPTQEFINMYTSNIPEVIIALGFLISIFVSLSIYYATILSQKNKTLKVISNDLKIANEELEEFAYRTSHDLRSPLISSMTVLDIAAEAIKNNDTTEAIECLDHAKDSLKTLEQLVKDILALTQTKNQEEETQPLLLGNIIDDALQKLAHMDNFERLDIQKELTYAEPIEAKKSRITLIVENLISNAIKYQDASEPHPYLKISTNKEGGRFIFKVEDNGVGIPKEHQDKLFQMFKRFHNQSYGSGLGLYMMKKSADILGADLVYEDAQKGTIFKLLIPMN
ncbi:MAG: sensor histidine kinase [Alcanivorax sp.]